MPKGKDSIKTPATSSDSHNKDGVGRSNKAPGASNQKPVTSEEREAMRAYLMGERGNDLPAPTRANRAYWEEQEKLTAAEQASIMAYLRGPRFYLEPVPGRASKFSNRFPALRRGAMMAVVNVVDMALRQRIIGEYNDEVRVYDVVRTLLQAAASTSCPPSGFVTRPGEPQARISSPVFIATLRLLVDQSQNIRDSKEIICLAKEWIDVDDGTVGTEINEIIAQEFVPR